jgi:hypothetical protein
MDPTPVTALWWRRVIAARFGIILVVLPTVWALLALDWLGFGTRTYLGNTLLLDDSLRVLTLSFLASLITAFGWKIIRVTAHYGPWRFDQQPAPPALPDTPLYEVILSALAGWTLPLAAWGFTLSTTPADQRNWGVWFLELGCLVVGGALAVGAIYGVRWLSRMWLDAALVRVLEFFGLRDGYIVPGPDGKLTTAGHSRLLAGWILALLGYYVAYFTFPDPDTAPFSVAFYALIVLFAPLLLLAALGFFFDRWRVPVLVIWILVFLLVPVDHYYPIQKFTAATPATAPETPEPTLASVVAGFPPSRFPKAGTNGHEGRTLVIVTAEGGGIQASAWTARVLTGLHELYPDTFTDSLAVISSISGGSVGTMFYLAGWDKLHAKDADERAKGLRTINANAQASSLEAAVWGFSFYDLPRRVNPLFSWPFLKPFYDRGKALDDQWSQRLTRYDDNSIPNWTFRGALRQRVQNQKEAPLPIPIFNSTLVETGQRFRFAPVRLQPDDTGPVYLASADEFLRLYPESDINMVTAARLSASFSYVTPMSRPLRSDPSASPLPQGWLADGGYADYEGLASALDAVIALSNETGCPASQRKGRGYDRILLLRILGFPDLTFHQDDDPKTDRAKVMGGDGQLFLHDHADTDRPTTFFQRWTARSYGNGLEATGPLALTAQVRVGAAAEFRERQLANWQDRLVYNLNPNQADRPPGSDTNSFAQMSARLASGVKPTVKMVGPVLPASDFVPLFALKISYPDHLQVAEGDGQRPLDAIPISWKLTKQQLADIDRAWKQQIDAVRTAPLLPEDLAQKVGDRGQGWTLDALFTKRP